MYEDIRRNLPFSNPVEDNNDIASRSKIVGKIPIAFVSDSFIVTKNMLPL